MTHTGMAAGLVIPDAYGGGFQPLTSNAADDDVAECGSKRNPRQPFRVPLKG